MQIIEISSNVLTSVTLGSTAAIPLIVAIVQALKYLRWVKDKWAPFLSIVTGMVVAFFLLNNTELFPSGKILIGVILGLAASGLYSTIKETAHGLRNGQKEKQNHTNHNK